MCYMGKPAATRSRRQASNRVGVRELRQNLSVYLDRVIGGETLEVSARGRPVAVLAPLPAPATTVERLVAAGRAQAATRRFAELPRLQASSHPGLGARAERALQELREDTV
jgi:prevent-host-death family protein